MTSPKLMAKVSDGPAPTEIIRRILAGMERLGLIKKIVMLGG